MISPRLQVGWFYVTIQHGKCQIFFRRRCNFFVQSRPVSIVPPGRGGVEGIFSHSHGKSPWAIGSPSLRDGFFLPPLFPRKRGGQGVSLRNSSTAEYAENATYYSYTFFLAPLASVAVEKSVKMNFGDPSEFTSHLFKFNDLQIHLWVLGV